MKKTFGLIEQHIHGAYGIDFMKSSSKEICDLSEQLLQDGVAAFFPTIMTDDLNLIKERIKIIKEAQSKNSKKNSQIIGIHLEGPFINPNKSGIHDKKYIQPLNIEIFKKIEDEFIKIITIAPELDKTGEFIKYLNKKNIKISAGHCECYDFQNINQVTHLYNAMGSFLHRGDSCCVKALINRKIYTEIIADSQHVSDDVLKLTFKIRPKNKIILISDALPLAHSDKGEYMFAGQKIYNHSGKLVNAEGVFAGSSMLLCDIIKNLTDKKILKFEDAIKFASSNMTFYHKVLNKLTVYWNEDNTINRTELK